MTADAAREAFIGWLEQERHAAANTVEAYGHALAGFLGFLTRHLGGEPDLAALAELRAADITGLAGSSGQREAGGIVARPASVGVARFFPLPEPPAWRRYHRNTPCLDRSGAPGPAPGTD